MSNTTNDTTDELFELCRSVYEATGWGDNEDFRDDSILWWYDNSGTGYTDHRVQGLYEAGKVGVISHPCYSSDYLLEKLRDRTFVIRLFAMSDEFVEKRGEGAEYCVSYRKMWDDFSGAIYADTSLKALLKLTLALSKEGLL